MRGSEMFALWIHVSCVHASYIDASCVYASYIHDACFSNDCIQDVCIHDACFRDAAIIDIYIKETCIIDVSMILAPDICVYDACMHDAYMILSPWPWTLMLVHLMHVYMMHVCMMHVCMILVWCTNVWYTYFWSWSLILIHACIYDAYICDVCMNVWSLYDAQMYDTYISDPDPWSLYMHVSMMHISVMQHILSQTDQRTNEQGDSRSWMYISYLDMLKFQNR